MSFQPAIPRRVALQHCPSPLRQPASILLLRLPNFGDTDTHKEEDCFQNRNRLETAIHATQGWVNDHENPWVNDCENPHLDRIFSAAGRRSNALVKIARFCGLQGGTASLSVLSAGNPN